MPASNQNLRRARRDKNDEFYTKRSDIENEVRHYKKYFKDKVVYCNADDPRESNFFHYFSHQFEFLGLKKLITTCYKSADFDNFSKNDSDRAIRIEFTGPKNGRRVPSKTREDFDIKLLNGDGDFRSQESIELLKQSDIVVTNPPFSLFREFVDQLMQYNKKFLIIGNFNAVTYKEIFKLIKENKIWIGYGSRSMDFIIPERNADQFRTTKVEDGKTLVTVNACWFTNLDVSKRHEDLILYRKYNPEDYPKYDNYDAINVSRVANIPMDYGGYMGVPVTFIEKYNPEQFEIVKFRKGNDNKDLVYTKNNKVVTPYFRIIIRNKRI